MDYKLISMETNHYGNIQIMVESVVEGRYYPIGIAYSPVVHAEKFDLAKRVLLGEKLKGVDLQKFNNMIKQLHEENVRALVKAGHLDAKTKLPV